MVSDFGHEKLLQLSYNHLGMEFDTLSLTFFKS